MSSRCWLTFRLTPPSLPRTQPLDRRSLASRLVNVCCAGHSLTSGVSPENLSDYMPSLVSPFATCRMRSDSEMRVEKQKGCPARKCEHPASTKNADNAQFGHRYKCAPRRAFQPTPQAMSTKATSAY